jgi:hypothetical protein
MSKLDQQNKTYGSIAALQTIVNSYPTLNLINDILGMFQTTSPIEFILNILRICGITREEIINWLTEILTGERFFKDKDKEGEEEYSEEEESKKTGLTKEQKQKHKENLKKTSDGILVAIEYAIKCALFANIKGLFSGCQIDPFIPEWLLDESDKNSDMGISVPISAIDMFGMLNNCPVNDGESIYYFDCKPSGFGYNYTPGETCNSIDFNAFLWYVINVSNSYGAIWDNRNYVIKELLSDINKEGENYTYIHNEFFSHSISEENLQQPFKANFYDANGEQFKYKPILRCQYINSGAINEGGELIKVTLPTSTYTYKAHTPTTDRLTRTIFEFNYDYIFSLKLFETKSLVANIVNSLLGLSQTIKTPIDVRREVVRKEIKTMVKNLIAADVDNFNGICATSFSNDEYNKMLNNSNTYINSNGLRTPNSDDIEKLLSQVKKLEYSSTLDKDLTDLLNTVSEITKPVDDVEYKMSFLFDLSFVYRLIEELMIEIILQLMTPKVMMLYYINTCVMKGSVANIQEWIDFGLMCVNPVEFVAKFSNLILNAIRQIIDILIKELMNFLMEYLTPMIKIFAMELLLETIRDYKDLINQIIATCVIPIPSFAREGLVLDDVRYADIVPVLEAPNNDC